ncbi:APC family permease [Vibrio sp. S4M6]|uniref:APC family permease n=1 Tax=Vibrio sinus TaxID=2946865 RepID=UPI002029EA0D|nr:APC family permease [Vibrio sinus]MCL9783712.1 APC family permease [Vibrio sinus]
MSMNYTQAKPKRRMGLLALTMTGVGSVIGSGWLFGAYHAAKIAGPASIVSWIIGWVAVLIVALTYMEVSTVFPKSGGPVRYLEFTHGSVVGYMAAWATWLSIVTVIPIEAEASVQYMATWKWQWIQPLTSTIFNMQTHSLSTFGLAIAAVLMIIYFLLNFWSVNLFSKSQTSITIFKMLVPVICVTSIVVAGFHPGNFTAVNHSFAPYGWAGALTAVATAGIVFAYNGFQSPMHFAGEAKNPKRDLPLAIILTLAFALVLYIGLQVSFIGGIEPSVLAKSGWSLDFDSPFAQLAIALNLNLVVLLLYVDAFVSPTGTGITYMGTTTRMLFAMSEHGHMPKCMSKLHSKYHIPRAALWTNLVIGFVFLYLFRGWGQLAGIISAATVVTYIVGPMAAMSLRKIAPEINSPIRLKYLNILAPLGFAISSEVLYWSRWPLTGKVIIILLLGFVIYAYFQNKRGWDGIGKHVKASLWMMCYFVAMMILSYIGSSQFGGINILPFGYGMAAVAVASLIFFYWGINSAWRTQLLEKELNEPNDLISDNGQDNGLKSKTQLS